MVISSFPYRQNKNMYSWLAFIPVILIYGSVVLTWFLRKFFRDQEEGSLYDQPMVDDDDQQQMLTDEHNTLTDNNYPPDQLTDGQSNSSSLGQLENSSNVTQKSPIPEDKIDTLTDDRHTHDDSPLADKNKCKTD